MVDAGEPVEVALLKRGIRQMSERVAALEAEKLAAVGRSLAVEEERAAVAAQLYRVESQLAEARATIAAVQADAAEAHAAAAEAHATAAAAHATAAAAQAAAAERAQRIAFMTNTTSWRITWPLRRADRVLRRIRRYFNRAPATTVRL